MDNSQNKIDIVFHKTKKFIKNLNNSEWDKLPYWLMIGTKVAELVEKFKDIEGIEKKQLVLRVVELILEDKTIIIDMEDSDREQIKTLVNLALPATIDLVIKATKGEIEINKKCNFLCFSCKP
mgnify:CR=1 FL=1